MELVDSLSLLGETLIRDDAGDLGYLTYRNRRRHRYHGRIAPDHPSPVHHYMAGTGILLMSYLFAPIAMVIDMKDTLEED